MQEFFKGWRRKAGSAVLIAACVVAAGWIRSVSTQDAFRFPTGTHKTAIQLVSASQSLGIFWIDAPRFSQRVLPIWWRSSACQVDRFILDVDAGEFRYQSVTDHAPYGEFSHEFGSPGNITVRSCLIPYWIVAVLLALCSAWLLLSRRRSSPALEFTVGPRSNNDCVTSWRNDSGFADTGHKQELRQPCHGH